MLAPVVTRVQVANFSLRSLRKATWGRLTAESQVRKDSQGGQRALPLKIRVISVNLRNLRLNFLCPSSWRKNPLKPVPIKKAVSAMPTAPCIKASPMSRANAGRVEPYQRLHRRMKLHSQLCNLRQTIVSSC